MPFEIDFALDAIDTELELLRQICARLDRHFPDREAEKQRTAALREVDAIVKETAQKLDALGMTDAATKVRDLS